MKTLQGKTMRYALNEHGQAVSVYNRLTCHEYVYEPADIWKIIYSEGTERVEIPIWAQGQAFTRTDGENGFTLTYDSLRGDGRQVNFALRLHFAMTDEGLTVESWRMLTVSAPASSRCSVAIAIRRSHARVATPSTPQTLPNSCGSQTTVVTPRGTTVSA